MLPYNSRPVSDTALSLSVSLFSRVLLNNPPFKRLSLSILDPVEIRPLKELNPPICFPEISSYGLNRTSSFLIILIDAADLLLYYVE